MENPNQQLFSLNINENAKTQLRGAAAMAGIAALLSLINAIIKLVISFTNKGSVEYISTQEGFGTQSRVTASSSSGIAGAVITLIISILLFYFLNRFASQVKTGLNGNNAQLVNSGFGGLSSYFITIGVLVIICLVLVLLVIAGAASGMR